MSEQRGCWQVAIQPTHFGDVLRHGIQDDGLFAFIWLPPVTGWKLGPQVYLSGQTYKRKADEIIAANPSIREIAIINLYTGQWVSVWLRRGETSCVPSHRTLAAQLAEREDENERLRAALEPFAKRADTHDAVYAKRGPQPEFHDHVTVLYGRLAAARAALAATPPHEKEDGCE